MTLDACGAASTDRHRADLRYDLQKCAAIALGRSSEFGDKVRITTSVGAAGAAADVLNGLRSGDRFVGEFLVEVVISFDRLEALEGLVLGVVNEHPVIAEVGRDPAGGAVLTVVYAEQ